MATGSKTRNPSEHGLELSMAVKNVDLSIVLGQEADGNTGRFHLQGSHPRPKEVLCPKVFSLLKSTHQL